MPRKKSKAAKKRSLYRGDISLNIHDVANLSEGRYKEVMAEKAFNHALKKYVGQRADARRAIVREIDNARSGAQRSALLAQLKAHDARHRRLNAFSMGYIKPFMNKYRKSLSRLRVASKAYSGVRLVRSLSKKLR